jgi:tRNA(Ile)-lysidine synthase
MEEKISVFIKKHQLLKDDSTIVVGVSGGPDSLALLHYLWSKRVKKNWKVIVAHVDHMFRGNESREDLEFVERYCVENEIIFESVQIDVTAYQKEKGLSSQVAARECRFSFFEHVMDKYHATVLALAQHGDDQIETMLMRLVRGGTSKSISGIQPIRPFHSGFVIRPFLPLTKDDILQYCREHSLTPRFDPSNEKGTYTRNRYRKEMLPFLKQENPNVHTAFQQFSEQLVEDECFLEELSKESLNRVIKKQEQERVEIFVDQLLALPIPLQRRVLQLILNYLYQSLSSSLSSIHIEQIFKLVRSDHPSGVLHLPHGLQVKRSYQTCMFTFKEEKISTYEFNLLKEDKIVLPNGDQIWSETHFDYPLLPSKNMLILASTEVNFPLIIRTRRQGDKIELKGMKGSKKIKDIFIDEKIPLAKRELWPIVEDCKGQILWIPGLKKSRFEVSNLKTSRLYTILFYSREYF